MIEVTQHQMLAIMLARWGLPFTGRNIPVGFAPDCNAKWPEGAANE